MRKFVWFYICFFVLLSFSYMEETDISGLSRDEVNNIIGTWEDSSYSRGSFANRVFSWGIGAYIPNQSIIIDYVDETKKLIYVFHGGMTLYIRAIKSLGLNRYQVDLYSTEKEEWSRESDSRATLYFVPRGETTVFMDFSETWLFGERSNNTLMVKISGPVIKMTEAFP